MDFENGIIQECYVIFDNKAVKIESSLFTDDVNQTKDNIRMVLEKIKGDRSHP